MTLIVKPPNEAPLDSRDSNNGYARHNPTWTLCANRSARAMIREDRLASAKKRIVMIVLGTL